MLSLENITRLRGKISRKTCIVVEGKRDRDALEKLRFKNIITISGKSDENLIDAIRMRTPTRVAILTDFDREGGKKHKELKRLFEKEGIKTDFAFRDNFKRTFKVSKIEEVSSVANCVDEYYKGNSHSTTRKTFFIKKFMKRRKRERGREAR